MTTPAANPDAQARMQAIAAGLAAAGLACQVHDTCGVLYITATVRPPGARPVEVIVDDDMYAEVRYWHPADATPGQVTATISAALTAITSQMTTPG